MNHRLVILLLCCIVFFIPLHSFGEPMEPSKETPENGSKKALQECRRWFQEGLICYGNLDYQCARSKFRQASQRATEDLPKHERLEIERYLAITFIALGEEKPAKDCFVRMLERDRDARMDAERVSPKVFMLFEKVRRTWLAEHPPEPEEKPEAIENKPSPEEKPAKDNTPESQENSEEKLPRGESPDALRWVEFRLACAVLGGSEMETFGVGFQGGLALLWNFPGTPWFVSPFIEYQAHPFSSSQALHHLQAGSEFGYHLQFGKIHLLLPVGTGVGFIGRGGISDEVGLGWRVHPAVHVAIGQTWSIGFGLGPRGVILLNRKGSSTYFVAGMHTALRW